MFEWTDEDNEIQSHINTYQNTADTEKMKKKNIVID